MEKDNRGRLESPSSRRWIFSPFDNVINREGVNHTFSLKPSTSTPFVPRISDLMMPIDPFMDSSDFKILEITHIQFSMLGQRFFGGHLEYSY